MEVDVGCVSENPGTDPESSGTRQDNPEEPDPADPMDIDEPIPLSMIRPAPRWAQGIMSYMEDGELPDNEVLARQIQRRSKAYTIFHGELHKKSVTTILQRCVEPEEGDRILQDVHGGDCGHHASSRYLVAKVFQYGFY